MTFTPKFIAISGLGWGASPIKENAIRTARRNSKGFDGRTRLKKGDIKVYEAHPDTGMFNDGSWEYPEGHAPKLIETI